MFQQFLMTTSPGLSLFTISIDVLINTICNYIVYIRITWHKGCLITFHVPSDKIHPGKASRKIIYSRCKSRREWISFPYTLIILHWFLYMFQLFYNFGWFDRKTSHEKSCKECKIRHYKSTAQHIICECKSLSNLRTYHWVNAHNTFVKIYNKANTLHQRFFGFRILQTLQNIHNIDVFGL